MDKAQKGFTLIELVVVITILGILAAFAFPRFASLDVEARKTAVNALGGSVRSAAAQAHSMSLFQDNAATITIHAEWLSQQSEHRQCLAGLHRLSIHKRRPGEVSNDRCPDTGNL